MHRESIWATAACQSAMPARRPRYWKHNQGSGDINKSNADTLMPTLGQPPPVRLSLRAATPIFYASERNHPFE